MNSSRRIALVAGIFFAITYIASIPALSLYDPVLNDPNYIVGVGADTQVSLGAFCEIILAIANVGTAVTLFPFSNGRTKASPSAMSPFVSLNPPSSSSGSSASSRS
jgi:hypothetical protein